MTLFKEDYEKLIAANIKDQFGGVESVNFSNWKHGERDSVDVKFRSTSYFSLYFLYRLQTTFAKIYDGSKVWRYIHIHNMYISPTGEVTLIMNLLSEPKERIIR